MGIDAECASTIPTTFLSSGMIALADRMLDLAIELGDWKWLLTTRNFAGPHPPLPGPPRFALTGYAWRSHQDRQGEACPA
jgi:hypothetical protein